MVKPISKKLYKRATIEIIITISPLLIGLILINIDKDYTHYPILMQIYFLFTGFIGFEFMSYPTSIINLIIVSIVILAFKFLIISGVLLAVYRDHDGLGILLSLLNLFIAVVLAMTGFSVLLSAGGRQ